MNFLPKDYKSPTTSNNYLKLQDGENRIRILSKPIFGWEDWLDKKPVRFRLDQKPSKSFDPKKAVKHFWAFIVYNYNDQQIQIMQITQATIRNRLEELCRDEDWGSPFNYDIKIFKKGERIETEYSVNQVPHKTIDQSIIEAFKERPINLDAIFDNLDPFSKEWDTFTPLMSEDQREEPKITSIYEPQIDVKPLYISDDQFIELSELKNGCSEKVQEGFNEYLKNSLSITGLAKLLNKDYVGIKQMLVKRFQENQKEALEAEMNNQPSGKNKK